VTARGREEHAVGRRSTLASLPLVVGATDAKKVARRGEV